MNFLIQSPHGWRDLWQRPHHLASRFAAAGHTVRWVEPRYLRWLIDANARFLRARAESPLPRLEVRPVTLINGERWSPIRKRNRERLSKALSAPFPVDGASSARAPTPTILWLYNPHESHLADSVPHDLLIYDIMDEYLGFPWSPASLEMEERRLLERADWVFAGTQALYDSKESRAHERIECLLSGVDTAHFARARTPGGWWEAAESHSDIARLSERYERLIGYAGMIDLRIDQELIVLAANRHPEWGFICVGEARTEVSLLEDTPNVHLLGPLPYSDLPAYYASWDVGLVPFRENRLTVHTNPTKILEYAAAGLPIVAPALPEITRFYSEGAFLYHSDEEFLVHLEMLLSGERPPMENEDVRRRADIASHWSDRRSWEAIAGQMLARVESLLA